MHGDYHWKQHVFLCSSRNPNHNVVRLTNDIKIRVKRIASVSSHKTERVGETDNGRSVFMWRILCKDIQTHFYLLKKVLGKWTCPQATTHLVYLCQTSTLLQILFLCWLLRLVKRDVLLSEVIKNLFSIHTVHYLDVVQAASISNLFTS